MMRHPQNIIPPKNSKTSKFHSLVKTGKKVKGII